MTIIPGTTFYLWVGYGALIVLTFLIGRILFSRVETREVRGGSSVKFVLVGGLGLGLCFFAYLFFKDFYGIDVQPDRVRLVYPWPRPDVIVDTQQIDNARVLPQGRRRAGGAEGSIEIISRGRVYHSAGIYDRDTLREARHWVASWKKE